MMKKTKGNCKIIIVDDEEKNIIILKELLDKDYELRSCHSGEACLTLCETFCPDIILLDVVMPGIGGLETCKKLKNILALQQTRIVLVSSNSLIDDKLKGYMVGADDYLIKPFDYTELLMKMKVYSKLINAEKHIAKMNESLKKQVQMQTQKLMQSEKMASIGQLAAGVAHEINNPMCFISTNIEALGDYINDLLEINHAYKSAIDELAEEKIQQQLSEKFDAINEEYQYQELVDDLKNLIDESLEGTERVTTIVNDLKTFARTDDRLESLDINELIKKSLNVVGNQLKNRCEVIQDLPPLPRMMGIRTQLSQVFVNLFVNAGQAMGDEYGKLTISSRADEGKIIITVSDTGCGIEKKHLGKIFDPFHTTKPVGVGTGLGLSISYAIIEKHKGKIEVTSEKDIGTTFTLTLNIEFDKKASQ